MQKKRTIKSTWSHTFYLSVFIFSLGFYACQNESRGFVLPDGDVEYGKSTFIDLGCNHCHSIGDVKWMGNEMMSDVHIPLGGEVTSVKTYGELVTSIINPSHKISKKYIEVQELTDNLGNSKMEAYSFNEIMTVQELVDIVTFLQTKYKLVKPPLRPSYE